MIDETKAYFEAKDKLFKKNGIEMLEKRWKECITLEEDYVDEWSRILPKFVVSFLILRTYWWMCYVRRYLESNLYLFFIFSITMFPNIAKQFWVLMYEVYEKNSFIGLTKNLVNHIMSKLFDSSDQILVELT